MPKKLKTEPNGCRPFLQGYWARVEERADRDWPHWLNPDDEFKLEWMNGWKAADKHIQEKLNGNT